MVKVRPWTLRRLPSSPRQLHGVLSDIGVKSAAIVGFSLGGMIARRFAMDYPDCVSAICILHSPHRRTAAQQEAVAKRLVETTAGGAQATVDGALQRWLSTRFGLRNPETVDMVRRWVMANDDAVYPTNYSVLCHGVEELIAPDPPITCPALVVTGTEDPGQPPAMAEAIAAEIDGAQVEILPGLRHMGFTEQPELYNSLLFDFLDRLNAGGSDGD